MRDPSASCTAIATNALANNVLGPPSPDDEFRRSMRRTSYAVFAACAFGALLWAWRGRPAAAAFAAGYLVEQSLSVDNLFVFIMLFDYFKARPPSGRGSSSTRVKRRGRRADAGAPRQHSTRPGAQGPPAARARLGHRGRRRHARRDDRRGRRGSAQVPLDHFVVRGHPVPVGRQALFRGRRR
mmetsp:Transcript_14513/g.43337  ORF Transcript_14513/g.43337 Transcript_14513/m.43337 type:complete len:183 (-) Transcript_14513:601-1149(-)